MADVQPFRAVRYAGAAGALADLVAPPYDAVSDEERAALYTRSPYNVVHVTLPESAAAAGALYRDWLAAGILELDDVSSVWLVHEEFVGPEENVNSTICGGVISAKEIVVTPFRSKETSL